MLLGDITVSNNSLHILVSACSICLLAQGSHQVWHHQSSINPSLTSMYCADTRGPILLDHSIGTRRRISCSYFCPILYIYFSANYSDPTADQLTKASVLIIRLTCAGRHFCYFILVNSRWLIESKSSEMPAWERTKSWLPTIIPFCLKINQLQCK